MKHSPKLASWLGRHGDTLFVAVFSITLLGGILAYEHIRLGDDDPPPTASAEAPNTPKEISP